MNAIPDDAIRCPGCDGQGMVMSRHGSTPVECRTCWGRANLPPESSREVPAPWAPRPAPQPQPREQQPTARRELLLADGTTHRQPEPDKVAVIHRALLEDSQDEATPIGRSPQAIADLAGVVAPYALDHDSARL